MAVQSAYETLAVRFFEVRDERNAAQAEAAELRVQITALTAERDEARTALRAEVIASHSWMTEAEAAEARARELAEGVKAVDDLISQSSGVYGLHLNGDPSPWSELLPGGQFEEWLLAFEKARALSNDAPAEAAQAQPQQDPSEMAKTQEPSA
jgi:cell division protein YceG involved in septum cleavage